MTAITAKNLLLDLKDWMKATGGSITAEDTRLYYENGWQLEKPGEDGPEHFQCANFEEGLAELLEV